MTSTLNIAARLARVSPQALEMSKLYGLGELPRTVEATRWRFRWCFVAGPLPCTQVRLRIGGARTVIGVENLFGSGADVLRPELPAELRAAYLSGCGQTLWRELEAMTGLTVEVIDVELDSTLEITPEHLGFELTQEGSGRSTRGVVSFEDPEQRRNARVKEVLAEASRREMPAAPQSSDINVHWAAVVGTTRLPLAEMQSLEAQDVILVEDAAYLPKALACWLGVGPGRRYAGRATLSNRTLQMIQFGLGGNSDMTSSTAEATAPQESRLDEIPVTVRFELAQWSAPLARVAALAAGAVIDLGRPIDEQSVSVWIEQRCIGKGQLVAIGERLGVRLVSVFGANAAAADPTLPETPVGRST